MRSILIVQLWGSQLKPYHGAAPFLWLLIKHSECELCQQESQHRFHGNESLTFILLMSSGGLSRCCSLCSECFPLYSSIHTHFPMMPCCCGSCCSKAAPFIHSYVNELSFSLTLFLFVANRNKMLCVFLKCKWQQLRSEASLWGADGGHVLFVLLLCL